jgi:hypothetical protein
MFTQSQITTGKFHIALLPLTRVGKYIWVVPTILVTMLMAGRTRKNKDVGEITTRTDATLPVTAILRMDIPPSVVFVTWDEWRCEHGILKMLLNCMV